MKATIVCVCAVFRVLKSPPTVRLLFCYYFCHWPIDCLTTSSNDLLVTSNRTTSSFFLVSFLRALSWVTMVMSQPFTWERGERLGLRDAEAISSLAPTPMADEHCWRHLVGTFLYTPALFYLPPLTQPHLQGLQATPWSHRCPLTNTYTYAHTVRMENLFL